MKFRKKPVVIEAVQWTGSNEDEIEQFCQENTGTEGAVGYDWPGDGRSGARVVIETLEGTMFGSPGDWIIRGIKGEYYACKPHIFADSYEPVAEGR